MSMNNLYVINKEKLDTAIRLKGTAGGIATFISQWVEPLDARPQEERCTKCNGDGYTAEHAMDMSCNADEHLGCPIQIPCEYCNGKEPKNDT